MIPEKLTLSGFLSYQNEVEIDFSTFDLACISGANGSGKSSLLDAMTWSLFGQARARDDAIINQQSDTAEVSFTFSYEGNLYKVQRAKKEGKTTVLEFQIMGAEGNWKSLTERTMRATEAAINQILRLDYETFVNASFFLQGKADQFTQQRPADRKRILGSILGLEVWEKYRRSTATKRKKIEVNITGLKGRLEEINAELDQEDQRKARLAEIETNMAAVTAALETQTALLDEVRKQAALIEEVRKKAEALEEQASQTRSELVKLNQERDERQQEKDTYADLMPRQEEVEASYQAYLQLRTDLAEWDQTAILFNQQEKSRHAPLTEIETAKTRLEAELDTLKVKSASIKDQTGALKDLEAKLKQTEADTAQLEKVLAEREALESQLQVVQNKQTEAKAENPLLKSEMDSLKARIDQLTETEGVDCPLCGQPLSPEDRERLIKELNVEGKQKGDRYRANQDLLKSVEAQIKELKETLAESDSIPDRQREVTRAHDQTQHQIEAIQKEIEEWESEGIPRKTEVETLLEKEDYAHEARKTLAGIDEELKEIGYDAATHDKIRKQEQEQRSAEETHRKLENAQAALQPLEREIDGIKARIEQDTKKLEAQTKEAEEAAAQALPTEDMPDLVATEQKMLDLKEQENQIRMDLGAAQQNLAVLETLKQRDKELEAEKEEFAKQVANFKVLERSFGKNGVPAMLIEQALPQIESKANEILEKLSGGTTSIRFITQQKLKSKEEQTRETLEIVITDGQGSRGYEMYSGGEAFRINFAIRLSLSEILAQRAGARLQTLVIDEGFGSQDQLSRQRLIEAINIIRADFKKILVITHIESLKEAFPTRIEVTKTTEGSQVSLE